MILVSGNIDDWCGTVEDTGDWCDFIKETKPEPVNENFRVGPWICMILTPFEEDCVKEYWPMYYAEPAKYAGTYAAYCVFEAVCGIRYNRPAYMRPDSEMVNWETGGEA